MQDACSKFSWGRVQLPSSIGRSQIPHSQKELFSNHLYPLSIDLAVGSSWRAPSVPHPLFTAADVHYQCAVSGETPLCPHAGAHAAL